MWSLALDIPSWVTTVRDWKIKVLSEKGVGIGTFHFLGFHEVATYFISKIRKLYNLQYILNSMHLYWLETIYILVERTLHYFDS